MFPKNRQKYVVMAAAVVMQACLGGIYAWSSFVPALRSAWGYSQTQTQIVFGTCICVFSFLSVATGMLQDRLGPRPLSVCSGLLVGAAYLMAWRLGSSFVPLLAAVGVVGGVGIACGYVCPISTAVKWFPGRKGLVCGLAVAGYGGGAIALSRIVEALLGRGWVVLDIFGLVGAVYSPLIVLAGLGMISPPPKENYGEASVGGLSGPGPGGEETPQPSRLRQPTLSLKGREVLAAAPAEIGLTAGEAKLGALLRDRRFWLVFAGMFCTTAPGLAVIGNLKPIAQSLGCDLATAALAVSTLAVGNASGRILWGFLYDRIGGRAAMLLSMGSVAAAVLTILAAGACGAAFLTAAVAVGFCYGSAFAVYPAEVARTYGPRHIGKIYGLVLFAQGISALVGPALGGLSKDWLDSFVPGIVVAAALGAAGVVLHAKTSRRNPSPLRERVAQGAG